MPDTPFRSILFDAADTEVPDASEPLFFPDLNLDQVVESIVSGRDEYALAPYFHSPLRTVAAVEHRQAVFRDLEAPAVRAALEGFAGEMLRVRRYLTLARKQHYGAEQKRWLLDAAAVYRASVVKLLGGLDGLDLCSSGLRALRAYLSSYTESADFTAFATEIGKVLDGLRRVKYTLRIKGARVTVARYEDEPDYSAEVAETFARFRQGAVESHLVEIRDPGSMDHVEARIAELVARLYPETFRALDAFCRTRADFLDPVLVRFEREVQFCLAYLEHMERLMAAGTAFCYPEVSTGPKEISVHGAVDIALAANLAAERRQVVRNDVVLHEPERILVVTGPNQGGKTTFARMFGQLHYLASLGVPVPAVDARHVLLDQVFTHFEKEEDIRTLRGKLDDELVRVRRILDEATSASIVILNEIFTSTAVADAVFLGREVLNRIRELGCAAVCVTFVDELAAPDAMTVSMVATVDPDDPSRRTFEIVRRSADGRAYASALAAKYGLSSERLRERIRP